jgi:hypothetical protein
MNKRYVIRSIILSIFLIFSIFTAECTKTDIQTVEGRLFVTGNEPFTELAIETSASVVYKLTYPEEMAGELGQLQGKVLIIKCKDVQSYDRFNKATVVSYKLSDDQIFQYDD